MSVRRDNLRVREVFSLRILIKLKTSNKLLINKTMNAKRVGVGVVGACPKVISKLQLVEYI